MGRGGMAAEGFPPLRPRSDASLDARVRRMTAAVTVEARCRRVPVSLAVLGPRDNPPPEDEDDAMFVAKPVVRPNEFDGVSVSSAVVVRWPLESN